MSDTPNTSERIFCERFPRGWDFQEMRVEAFLGTGDDAGHVMLSDTSGARLRLEWHKIEDVAHAMLEADGDLSQAVVVRQKVAGGVDGPAR